MEEDLIPQAVATEKSTVEVERPRMAQRAANKISFADFVRKYVSRPDGAQAAQVWDRKLK